MSLIRALVVLGLLFPVAFALQDCRELRVVPFLTGAERTEVKEILQRFKKDPIAVRLLTSALGCALAERFDLTVLATNLLAVKIDKQETTFELTQMLDAVAGEPFVAWNSRKAIGVTAARKACDLKLYKPDMVMRLYQPIEILRQTMFSVDPLKWVSCNFNETKATATTTDVSQLRHSDEVDDEKDEGTWTKILLIAAVCSALLLLLVLIVIAVVRRRKRNTVHRMDDLHNISCSRTLIA